MAVDRQLSLLVLAATVLSLQEARAQAGPFQGAWLEEGSPCASVFVATQNAVAFKRPANAFAAAFIIAGKRLTTPLATCRLMGIDSSGERRILRLSCTTSVSSDTARAVLAPAEDGAINRYPSVESQIATKYRRCSRDDLKTP